MRTAHLYGVILCAPVVLVQSVQLRYRFDQNPTPQKAAPKRNWRSVTYSQLGDATGRAGYRTPGGIGQQVTVVPTFKPSTYDEFAGLTNKEYVQLLQRKDIPIPEELEGVVAELEEEEQAKRAKAEAANSGDSALQLGVARHTWNEPGRAAAGSELDVAWRSRGITPGGGPSAASALELENAPLSEPFRWNKAGRASEGSELDRAWKRRGISADTNDTSTETADAGVGPSALQLDAVPSGAAAGGAPPATTTTIDERVEMVTETEDPAEEPRPRRTWWKWLLWSVVGLGVLSLVGWLLYSFASDRKPAAYGAPDARGNNDVTQPIVATHLPGEAPAP